MSGQPRSGAAARLGSGLRAARLGAGLSGAQMADRVKVSQPTISRWELGERLPDLRQVGEWARAAGIAGDRRAVLVASAEAAIIEESSLREKLAGGLAPVQEQMGANEQTARIVRNFQCGMVPGLLQTADYARAVLGLANITNAHDVDQAVAARLRRQDGLREPGHRFDFLVTEAALRWRPSAPEVLAGQLREVAERADLESVSVAVIPTAAEVHALIRCAFVLFEDRADGLGPIVHVEMPHSLCTVSEPVDVQMYRDDYARLMASALLGGQAVTFIRDLADEYGGA